MPATMSNNSLMIPFFLLLLFLRCYWCSGRTAEDSNIKGFITEPLDFVCIRPRRDKNMTVARYLSQNLKKCDTPERFVTSKWDETIRNFTKICNTEHKLNNICSQVTSYVTANVTHFVIESAPSGLNGCKTLCAYEYKGHIHKKDIQESVQIIELRDKIKGCVGERIQKVCYSPSSYRCRSVTLKINNTETKTSDTNRSFHCLRDGYYDICNDRMNSSYVNGTCRVIFVFDKTPASLNNSRLHCYIRFQNISTDNYHDRVDSIIMLRYKRNGTTSTTASSTNTSTNGTTTSTEKDSAVTTASSLPATYLPGDPGTTSTTASSTTTSNNGMTTSTEKGWIVGVIVGIVIAGIVGVVTYWLCRRKHQQNNKRGGDNLEMSLMQPSPVDNNEAR